jgi:hypothetical protein
VVEETVLAQGLGDADRQAPRDEKGDRGPGTPAGRDHARNNLSSPDGDKVFREKKSMTLLKIGSPLPWKLTGPGGMTAFMERLRKTTLTRKWWIALYEALERCPMNLSRNEYDAAIQGAYLAVEHSPGDAT